MSIFHSPAKLNLFLRILYKREDGYHELASLFQAISLFDTLTFTPTQDPDRLTVEGITMPTDNSNLILRAAKLFRDKTGLTLNVNVHAIKRIPLEAGLGGGSSNAATTLWAMNELTQRPATLQQLTAWGAELGSDVSFFLSNGTAYCTGRGENLISLLPLKQPPSITIIKPNFGLSTPLVYRTLKAAELPQRDPKLALKTFYEGEPSYFNDLEVPAFSLSPALKELQEKLLKSGFETVVLAGSGSSLFCIGEGNPPQQNDLLVHKVHCVSRSDGSWYNPYGT